MNREREEKEGLGIIERLRESEIIGRKRKDKRRREDKKWKEDIFTCIHCTILSTALLYE